MCFINMHRSLNCRVFGWCGDRLLGNWRKKIQNLFTACCIRLPAPRNLNWPVNARSEVDFLIQKEEHIIPIEVKSSENLRSRSLRVYHDHYRPDICIRTSLAGFQKQEWMENIPLYFFHHWLKKGINE